MSRAGAQWLRHRFGRRAEEVRRAYRRLFDRESAAARLVLADLAALCHAETTCFVPGDPSATAFAEGKRAVFLHLLDLLQLTPQDLQALAPPAPPHDL